MNPVPTPQDHERALRRERLDAAILRALGERRAHRAVRTNAPSGTWDDLEQQIVWAATLLWETPGSSTLSDDLLAFTAFLAREVEITESLDLTADEEWRRFEQLAPRAAAALDEISRELLVDEVSEPSPAARALASAFAAIRAQLAAACVVDWRRAA